MVKTTEVLSYSNITKDTILVSHNPVKPRNKEFVLNNLNKEAGMEIGK